MSSLRKWFDVNPRGRSATAANGLRQEVHSSLRIAVIGSRGIPGRYGGWETFAEELCPRLASLGHTVTVYCRAGYTGLERSHKGVRLIHTPYLRHRELETLSHEFTSIVHSLSRDFDLYYFLGTRSSFMYAPLRLSRRAVVVHTDGIEWKRRKWNRFGRGYLHWAERFAAGLAADCLVTDAQAMRRYYLSAYGRDSVHIRYGARALSGWDAVKVRGFGLEPEDYYLVVARIEPENNVDLVVSEFIESGSRRTLAVVGGSNYRTWYGDKLDALAAKGRVKMLGPVYGDDSLDHLYAACFAYVHGHEVGGTNPSLLRAMGAGRPVLALDTDFNAENLDGTGLLWKKRTGSLAALIKRLDANPQSAETIGEASKLRIQEEYSWDDTARRHDELFRAIVRSLGSIRKHRSGRF